MLALGAAGAFTAFVYSGVYNVAATEAHTAPVYLLLETTMRQSVRRHARGLAVPPLASAPRIGRGQAIYDSQCARCHGAPGVAPEPFALGLMPPPANLAFTAREWPPEELFWVVKYGIRATGMPAWAFRLTDDDIWSVVAYLQVLAREFPRDAEAVDATERPADGAAQVVDAPDATRGRRAVQQYACATCHTIPGVVGAEATVGPPLGAMGRRAYIAGVVPNTDAEMVRWLRDPRAVHARSAMPNLGVSERDARDMAAYLRTLR
jgi:mono/diheme cytochrome c family protein